MNILTLGSGGREHALCWKIRQSPLVDKLYCAPGNGGITQTAECVNLDMMDSAAIAKFCKEKSIDLVVIGPEAPLVTGVADRLRGEGIAVFGPGLKGAMMEGSKRFTKAFATNTTSQPPPTAISPMPSPPKTTSNAKAPLS